MSEDYKRGFDAGYEFAKESYDPTTGKHSKPFPPDFQHRQGAYNCGFGEGLISGRSFKIDNAFPGLKNIHWQDGQAVVTY